MILDRSTENIRESSRTNKTSPQLYARAAGFLYLLLAVLGGFSLIYLPSIFIVPGDPAATVNNILASELLYRVGIGSNLLIQLINIFVVLLLYKLLKPVNKNMATLMVIFFLLAVPMAMLVEVNHIAILHLLSDAEPLAIFSDTRLQITTMLLLDIHELGIHIASIFWGLWLFPMGYLVYKSGFLPKIIGILLMIGCFGYLIDFVLFLLFPDIELTVSQFTFIGEVLFPLWLLIKGVDVDQWEKRALESA